MCVFFFVCVVCVCVSVCVVCVCVCLCVLVCVCVCWKIGWSDYCLVGWLTGFLSLLQRQS